MKPAARVDPAAVHVAVIVYDQHVIAPQRAREFVAGREFWQIVGITAQAQAGEETKARAVALGCAKAGIRRRKLV